MTKDGALAIVGFLSLVVGAVLSIALWHWQWFVYGVLALFAAAGIAAFIDWKDNTD